MSHDAMRISSLLFTLHMRLYTTAACHSILYSLVFLLYTNQSWQKGCPSLSPVLPEVSSCSNEVFSSYSHHALAHRGSSDGCGFPFNTLWGLYLNCRKVPFVMSWCYNASAYKCCFLFLQQFAPNLWCHRLDWQSEDTSLLLTRSLQLTAWTFLWSWEITWNTKPQTSCDGFLLF